ncbi:flippase [Sphingomonas baiyangensis]|nr:flippase [Sphingomonas baiyangensis]
MAQGDARRLIANAGWLVGDKLMRLGVGMFVLVWIARYLGPADFGLLNYGQALVIIFTAFAVMGLADIAVRDIVRQPKREQEIVATALLMRLGGGLIAIMLALALVGVARPGDTRALIVVAILAAGLLPQAFDVIDYRFQAHFVVRPVVLLRNGVFLLFSAAKCAAILLGAPIEAFAALIVLEFAAVASGLLLYARRRGLSVHPRCASLAEARRLWHESWPLLLRTLAIAAYMRVDQLVIAAYRDDAAVGIYAAAIRLPELWYFLPTAVMTAAVPFFTRSYAQSAAVYERAILRVMRPLVWLSIVVALALSLFASPIVTLLYGERYAGAAAVLAVYAWAGVFGTLGQTTNAWLINAGLMRHGLYQALAGLVVSIALNLLLVPRMGVVGAAWSYLAAQAISNVGLNALMPATRPIFRGQLRTFGLRV